MIEILPPSAKFAAVVMLPSAITRLSPNITLISPAFAVAVPVLLADITPPLTQSNVGSPE